MKPPTACHWLENKAWFFPPLAPGAEVDGQEDPELKSTPFWCNKTQDAFGPDGDSACPEDCTTKRSCFRPEVDL